MASDKDPGQLTQEAFNTPANAHQVLPVSGMVPSRYDQVIVAYPSTTTEEYTFYLSGSSVGIITINYTSTSKSEITSVYRT